MYNNKLAKQIEELEVLIADTDESIAKAVFISTIMTEPNKSEFMETIHRQKAQLESNKAIVAFFKTLLKD